MRENYSHRAIRTLYVIQVELREKHAKCVKVAGYAISIHFVTKYQQLLLISPKPPLQILMKPIKLYIFLIPIGMGSF